MFGLLYSEFIQGSATRTWNCVAYFVNILRYKFNHLRDPIMPRSRRRHHSRSRSRSRSHSHERDREPKRRKIDIYESPHHKRSVSSEPEVSENENQNLDETLPELNNSYSEVNDLSNIQFNSTQNIDTTIKSDNLETKKEFENSESEESDKNNGEKVVPDKPMCIDLTPESPDTSQSDTPSKAIGKALKITPNKLMSPQQIQKKLDSEKKRIDRQKEKEEREKKRLEEKEERERLKEEKLKQKQDKEQQRLKEKIEKQKEKELKDELKKKEKEEREQKRREKEEKEEQKRKEKEQEKIKRQLEIDEKNKEKQKIEERKQKAAAVFVNFFVPKKFDSIEDKKVDEINSSTFMPFEVKSDMRLAPLCRKTFTNDDKNHLDKSLKYQNCDTRPYLRELKQGYKIGKSGKTFPNFEDNNDDDVMVIEDGGLGETIEDQKSKIEKMRAKFLKFHENQRPPYFGTWRKKSKYIRPKKPFAVDKDAFNYEIDSDDEWEEEGEGESLKGTDDEEDKENEPDEYEVDNEFFVPHCHLSDDEVDDEVNAKLSPESHKAKLRLLRNEFDEEMKSKTQKIKPRVLGCIWYDKTKSKVEEAIDRYLQPFAIICNGRINIPKRSDILTSHRKVPKQLGREHIPLFLRMIHGNVTKRKNLVEQFLEYMKDSGNQIDVSKLSLGKQFKQYADWMKCPDEGPMHNKFCWYVSESIRKEFNVDLQLPNKWVIISSKQDSV